jgi:DNA polymerase-3 subunit beta
MELAIGKADFARALASVAKAIEARNTIPVLSCVLLIAEDGRLRIRGTDLDVEVTDSAPADIAKTGSLCVDAKLLASIVGKAAGDISLTEKDGKVVVRSGKSRFTLNWLPDEDYPTMPDSTYAATFEADLAALFAPCVHAISTEETRYYLNGVFMHIQEDGDYLLRAVSTDGHRLTRHDVEYTGEDAFPGVIVPRKTVGLLPKGVLRVSVSDSRIRIEQGDLVIVSKLIDGTFPDYQRVIPRNNDKLISFDADSMKGAVGRVSVISTERGRAVRLSFASGGATLSVNNPYSGEATDEIAVDYSGEPIDIGLNSQYLADMISQFPVGDVRLALADPGSPTIFTSDKAERLLGVLMPMRV